METGIGVSGIERGNLVSQGWAQLELVNVKPIKKSVVAAKIKI